MAQQAAHRGVCPGLGPLVLRDEGRHGEPSGVLASARALWRAFRRHARGVLAPHPRQPLGARRARGSAAWRVLRRGVCAADLRHRLHHAGQERVSHGRVLRARAAVRVVAGTRRAAAHERHRRAREPCGRGARRAGQRPAAQRGRRAHARGLGVLRARDGHRGA